MTCHFCDNMLATKFYPEDDKVLELCPTHMDRIFTQMIAAYSKIWSDKFN